jgi:hypothetical protein
MKELLSTNQVDESTLNNTNPATENTLMTQANTMTTPNITDNAPEQSLCANEVLEQPETVNKTTEQIVQTLAEGSTGFFDVIKPQTVKKIAGCNPEELREFIRVKLFPRKDGLTTVYTTLAGITPLLVEGKKSFQVRSITKENALVAVLAIPKNILDSMLLIAQAEYIATKKHSASKEVKNGRLESKTLKALAKRNKLREETEDIKVEVALFEAKKEKTAPSTNKKSDNR